MSDAKGRSHVILYKGITFSSYCKKKEQQCSPITVAFWYKNTENDFELGIAVRLRKMFS